VERGFAGRRRPSPVISLVIAVWVALTLVGACSIDPQPNAPRVTNGTPSTLNLLIERDGNRTPLGGVRAGTTVYLDEFHGSCTDGTLIALAPNGDEVARRDERLCTGEAWSIAQ